MQTFLPYRNFYHTASCLDYRRLGKQRIETKQIYQTLVGNSVAWRNHPAVLMWKGYEVALLKYGRTICEEWINRGYKDSLLPWFEDLLKKESGVNEFPWWIGNELFHNSHRQTLLSKNVEHYSKFGWGLEPKYEYWWPTKN